MPAICLSEFTGSYDTFHELFNSLVNDNLSLTNVQRFLYLQSALKGEAANIISSHSATDDNYKIAWDLLNERYQNKKAITHFHVKSIFDLPSIPKESYSNIRKFLDSFQKHFRCLRNLGENVDKWHTILIYLLNVKLDSTTRKEWEIYTKRNDSPKIDDFTKFLNQRCQFLESIDSKLNTSNINQTHYKKTTDHNKHWQEERRNYVHVSSNNICPLCKQFHFIYTCELFISTPANNRFLEAKRLNLCTNCLRPGHLQRDCKSSHNCRTYKKRHHSLLHSDNVNKNNTAHVQYLLSSK